MNPPPPPAAASVLSFLERVLVRYSLSLVGGDSRLKEAGAQMVERLFSASSGLIAEGGQSGETLKALEESFNTSLDLGKDSPLALERGKSAIEEVLTLHALPASSAPPIPPLAAARAAFEELQALPPLAAAPGSITSHLESLQEGDLLLAGGRLVRIRQIVDCVERYEGQTWTWTELELTDLATGRPTSMDWEEDDEVAFSITYRSLTGPQAGLDSRAISRMDDRESGSHTFEGVVYAYSDSGEATRTVRGSGRKETFMYVELEGPAGVTLSAEDYDGEVQAWLSRPLASTEVQLVRGQA